MKFSALNKEASNSSTLATPSSRKTKPTQEAQESACLKVYHNAMKLQQEGKWEEAKTLYRDILESEVMEGGAATEAPPSSTILRLKFLVYKNIASVAKQQGDYSAAADAYIEATGLDQSDVTVWCQLSCMGSLLGNLLLARQALEQALRCQPTYWPALESMATVLYALGDFTACLHVIGRGLELDAGFPRGLAYLQHIVVECPGLVDLECPHLRLHLTSQQPEGAETFVMEAKDMWRRREALNGVIALRDPIVPPKKLSLLNLSSLASCLLSLYKHCKEQRSCSYTVPVDLSLFLETSLAPLSQHSIPPTAGVGVEGGSSGGEGRGGEDGKGRRETKRKLLDALEPFAPKRRSSRVLSRFKDKDHTNYFEMLFKYLPPWLRMRELPEIADFSPLKRPKSTDEDESVISERKRQVSALVDSTPCLVETAVVKAYVSKFQGNFGVLQLLQEFVQLLSLQYDHKWCQNDSTHLNRMFVELYESLHGHLCYPSPLCSPIEAQKKEFWQVAMMALCYVEMYVDMVKGKRRNQLADSATCLVKAPGSFLQCLSFVRHCDGLVGDTALETVKFTLRVQWCMSKWQMLTRDQDSAIQSLTMCKELLEVFYPEEEVVDGDSVFLMVHLPNCSNGGIISLDHVTERLQDLEQSVSLKEIRQLFDRKEYSVVVQKLVLYLEYNTVMPTDFLMGSKGTSSDVTNLSLLLDSLLHLQNYYMCMQITVQATLQLLQNYHLGNDLWISAVSNVFRVLDACLGCSEGCGQLKEKEDGRLLKRLVVCLLKAMDVVYEMADTDHFHLMPVAILWKIFYIVISNDWRVLEEEEEEEEMPVDERVKGPSTSPVHCGRVSPRGESTGIQDVSMREGCGHDVKEEVLMESGGEGCGHDVKEEVLESGGEGCGHDAKEVLTESGGEGRGHDAKEVLMESGGEGRGHDAKEVLMELGGEGRGHDANEVLMESGGEGRGHDANEVLMESGGEGRGHDAKEVLMELGGEGCGHDVKEEGLMDGRGHNVKEEGLMESGGEERGHDVEVESVRKGCGQEVESMDMSVPPPPTLEELSVIMSAIDDADKVPGLPSVKAEEEEPVGKGCSQEEGSMDVSPPQEALAIDEAPGVLCVGVEEEEEGEELSVTLQFLCEAHTHLGRMGWCCKDNGRFLLETVQVLRRELQILTRLPPKQREVLLQELEQCYYCLHGHPNKRAKARGLVDHNSEQIPLKWESALMLIEHYHPVPLPSIDDAKSPQITPEVIHLYKRITDVLPPHGKALSKDALNKYIEGQSSALDDIRPSHQYSSIISDVYYILADDALKGMDNPKAVRYYLDNLCYSPHQFDSWAGLALARSRIILERLSVRNFKTGMEKYIRKHTSSTRVCFSKAISLNSKHCYIVEKFGFFCYAIQSFASQILLQPRLFVLAGVHSWASTSRQEMLKLTQQCFTDALRLEGTKHAEPWIYHWMLGKIGYKLKLPIKKIMTNLIKSAQILCDDGASYPDLVEITSKLHAVESIEVHYQLHSIALKQLLQFSPQWGHHTDKDADEVEVASSVAEALVELKSLPLCRKSYPALWGWTKALCREGTAGGPTLDVGGRAEGILDVGGVKPVQRDLVDIAGEERMDVNTYETPPSLMGSQAPPTLVTPQTPLQAPPSLVTIQAPPPPISPLPVPPPPAPPKAPPLPVPPKAPSPSVPPYVSLLQLCLYGVAVCAVRYPTFYKPLYRMAASLHAMGLSRHARALLLGPLPPPLSQCQEKLQPLFVLKTNIFTNMWQVPVEEINRPGSFSSHARKNLELLVSVLAELKETQSLLQLAQLLKPKPDQTKRYLRDNERVAMHTKVVKQCVQLLVEVSKEQEFSPAEAAQLKTTATAIRNMANKLDSGLIKELDRATGCFQAAVSSNIPVTPPPTTAPPTTTIPPTTAPPTTTIPPTTAPPTTTIPPTTAPPTTAPPTTTITPTTAPPTTIPPTIAPPTTIPPTTAPTIAPPTTAPPTTTITPTTAPPTTIPPTIAPPTTTIPPTTAPTIAPPTTTITPTTAPPTTIPPTIAPPTTTIPPTTAPTIAPPTTTIPPTMAPTIAPPTTAPPTATIPPTTAPPTTTTPSGECSRSHDMDSTSVQIT